MIARATESDAPFARSAERYDRSRAAEPHRDDRLLDREHARVGNGMSRRLDEPREERAQRDLGIARHGRQCLHAELRDRLAVDAAACVGRQCDLPFVERRVEAGPGGRRAVAKGRIARPEGDAGGLRLVGVGARGVERPPAPRDDAADAKLAGHLLRRERHELREAEPGGGRLQPFATAQAGPRMEADDEAEAIRRDAGGQQRRETLTELLAHRAAREHGARAHERRRREVHLADDLRDLPCLLPPAERVAADVRTRGDEQQRPPATGGDAPQDFEHVRAVLRVRRRPRASSSRRR